MGLNYSDTILHSIKNTGEDLTLKKMFEISEQLILEHSDEIFGVTPINWEDSSWKQLSHEEVISLSHSKVYELPDSVLCLGKNEREPNIKYCLGTTVGMVRRFITIQNTGHNRRRNDGIRVECFPRILHIQACPRSPKVQEHVGEPEQFQRRIIFMSIFNDIMWGK